MNTKLTSLIVSAALVLGGYAHAATYNFYFNNTEQGEQSQASPSLTVNTDEKGELQSVQKGEGEPAQAQNEDVPPGYYLDEDGQVVTDAPASAEASAKPAQAAAASTGVTAANSHYIVDGWNPPIKPWRFVQFRLSGAFANRTSYTSETSFDEWGYPFERESDSGLSVGALATVGFWVSPYLGLNAMAGLMSANSDMDSNFGWGLEAELAPIHIDSAWMENFVEMGAMFGYSNLGIGDLFDNGGSFHFGGRVGVNITRHFGIDAIVRGWNGVSGEVGVRFRL
jgi:hypothetical protein